MEYKKKTFAMQVNLELKRELLTSLLMEELYKNKAIPVIIDYGCRELGIFPTFPEDAYIAGYVTDVIEDEEDVYSVHVNVEGINVNKSELDRANYLKPFALSNHGAIDVRYMILQH